MLTDAEAKHIIVSELWPYPGDSGAARHIEALRHVLLAMIERAELVDAFDADADCYSTQPGKLLPGVVLKARQHMEGK